MWEDFMIIGLIYLNIKNICEVFVALKFQELPGGGHGSQGAPHHPPEVRQSSAASGSDLVSGASCSNKMKNRYFRNLSSLYILRKMEIWSQSDDRELQRQRCKKIYIATNSLVRFFNLR
jgi:hypothetical protein